MPKTRRVKHNSSPIRPFRNSRAVVIANGEKGQIKGLRVHVDASGKVPATMRAGKDARMVTVGRVLTGVPRGKLYPYRSKKRGGVELKPGLIERAGQKIKRVVTGAGA